MQYILKIAIVVVALIFISVFANAQTGYPDRAQFSIGIDAGLPTGKLTNTHNFMLGASVQEAIPVAKALQFTINIGYNKFKGVSNVGKQTPNALLLDYPDLDMLAAKGGLKYFLSPMFYVQADAGIALVLNSPQTSYDAAKAFIYSPKIGLVFPVSGRSNVDIALRYEATNNFARNSSGNISSVSVGVAYGF